MIVNCNFCKEETYKMPSRVKAAKRNYCSWKCRWEGQKIYMVGIKQSKQTIARRVKKNTGKKRTEETKKKIGDANRGKKRSEKFKKMVSKRHKGKTRKWFKKDGLDKSIRKLVRYKEWRNSIFKKDKYICQKCGANGYVEAHHITLFSWLIKKYNIYTIEDAVACEHLWEEDNGITLCRPCHKTLFFRV